MWCTIRRCCMLLRLASAQASKKSPAQAKDSPGYYTSWICHGSPLKKIVKLFQPKPRIVTCSSNQGGNRLIYYIIYYIYIYIYIRKHPKGKAGYHGPSPSIQSPNRVRDPVVVTSAAKKPIGPLGPPDMGWCLWPLKYLTIWLWLT
jgi:hypothetical protein